MAAPVLGVVDVAADGDVADAVAGGLAGCARVARDLPGLEEAFAAGMVIIGRESWEALRDFASHPAMGEDIRARVLIGGAHSPEALAQAEAVRARFTAAVDEALVGVDALVMPTLPSVPPTLVEALDPRAVLPLSRLVRPFNLSGHPAITLPLRTAEGLPAGVQLVGRRGGDAALIAVAEAVFRSSPHFVSMQEN